jgi:hypothetical protein
MTVKTTAFLLSFQDFRHRAVNEEKLPIVCRTVEAASLVLIWGEPD